MENKQFNLNTLLSSSIIIFILPIVAYILAYFFNLGYNSYFNIPSFLTSFSFFNLLKNLPMIINFMVIMCLLTIVYLFFEITIKKFRILFTCILTMILLILFVTQMINAIKYHIIYILIVTSLFALISFFLMTILLIDIIKIIKLKYQLKHISNMIIKNDDDKDNIIIKLATINLELEETKNRFDNKTDLVISALPYKLTSKFNYVSTIILIVIFLLFLFGYYTAKTQEKFYLVNENIAVLNTYENSYIAVPIIKDSKISRYYFKEEYNIIPIDKSTLKLEKIGRLEPKSNK